MAEYKSRIAQDLAHAWARNLRLGNPLAKLVLCMLTQYVNGAGECFVGVSHLAEDCELSPTTIRERLAWLETAGVIRRVPQWIGKGGARNQESHGRQTSHLIKLLIDGVEEYSPEFEDEVSPPPREGLDDVSPPPREGLDDVSPPPREGLEGGLESIRSPLALQLRDRAESLNMNMNKDARARAARGARAPARSKNDAVAAVPALPKKPLRFVCKDSRQHWTMVAYRTARGLPPIPEFWYPGEGEDHKQHYGQHFEWDEVQVPLDWWGREHPGELPPGWVDPEEARGPPGQAGLAGALPSEQHQQTETSDHDEHRQSATGL
jgi:DNA-binding transcriptional ArsR family regulator